MVVVRAMDVGSNGGFYRVLVGRCSGGAMNIG